MHPTPGATEAPTSQGLTLAEHQAIRAIGPQPTPGPWQRIEWTRHAATTLVVPDATAATGLRVVAEFESEADAALGEAAPDMLACLDDIAKAWGTLPFTAPIGLKQRIDEARAKARGARRG